MELDYMLNGKMSRDRLNEIIKQAELENRAYTADEVETNQPEQKPHSFRFILTAVANLMVRGA